MRRFWLAVLISLTLAAVAALAADFWQTKKFTEWTEKEVQKLMKDSPWARPVEARLEDMGGGGMGGGRSGRGGRGGGGGGIPSAASGGGGMDEGGMGGGGTRGGGGMEGPQAPPSQTVTIRWHSALPVKQAVARARYGDEAGSSPEAAKNLARQETHYVVGIIGLPPMIMRGANPATLKSGALLKIKDRPPIEAEAAQPDRGERAINLYVFFPKATPGSHVITLEDKEVEVDLKVGSTNIRRKFKLKDMVFDGKLEI